MVNSSYIGRLAPSPTGLLHLGHARTFWIAQQRARAAEGRLFLRNDDLDRARCRPEFVTAMIEDLRWFGFAWEEPMITQSERIPLFRAALARLHAGGFIYPCACSRKDVQQAIAAPHEGAFNDEPLYPGTCRPENLPPDSRLRSPAAPAPGDGFNWRFRVPDGETLTFQDGHGGEQRATAGHDFGDFLVWRKDDVPSYQLASVVDDADLGITEVVRGADLIKSTFRQLLLFRALGFAIPAFCHCPLVTDEFGVRLAKRHDALALRTLREHGRKPAEIRSAW
ncbi:tRNA glutamyl-Q(34) synthetase GluQRS [Oleiharenicola lentus]|uniref:tRNA glutamyl-Q(34) synthetase GluQRS n=1 Tax=Oleiharenicola lentus TaxID=2508720 RepID=A0A4Q1C4I1_9BACT|nr:tRNA glutamyl-Q(34) synthetase GluQRS [Oleiharenicola lentus]RXK53307.1 tRNA glutamyl-Q(34) synthetase GluQRS [Oleiharenicola lentus]